jgi:hypothetical protein
MQNEIWIASGDGCPTCNALNGQVHSVEAWQEADLFPGSHRLICGNACRCRREPTDQPQTGNLETVPTSSRASMQIRLTAQVEKGFEIAVITAGQAKGHPWYYPAQTLASSVTLFNGVPCYIDHEGTPDKRRHSANDLAGRIHSPQWNAELQGITAIITPTGPAASNLRALAQAALDNPDLDIGFSADIEQQSSDRRNVDRIIRVHSTDVVLSPARGGQFLRALLSQGDSKMPDPESTTPQGATNPPAPDPALEQTRQQMQALLETQTRIDADNAQRAALQRTQAEMCSYLLTAGLNNSNLPAPVQTRLRARFENKVFTAEELNAAIKDQRTMLSELQGEETVQGFGRVGSMYDSRDQLTAAMDDLFQVKRDPETAKLSIHRPTGIRELYLMLTGDYDFTGAIDPQRAMLQSTTATFPGLVKNAMNKAIAEAWAEYGAAGYDWWQKIVTVETFETLNQISWIVTGTIASLPSINEGGEYPELQFGDNTELSSFGKRGGYVGITLEALDRDETRRLRQAPRDVAMAAMRDISEQVAGIFTANSATGPTLADGGALFNATAVTTAGGHANLLTTALGTNYTAWTAVAKAMYNQPMLVKSDALGTGKKQAIRPRYCLVPVDLEDAANSLFVPRWDAQAQNVGAVSPTWGGRVEPIVVPEWTDATDFAAVIDPKLVPGIMLGTRFGLAPQVVIAGDERDPAMFSNDESRVKVRHFLAVGIANYRALHKSNVAG